MTRKRIVILGAGLAGLSAAWHLQKKGVDALVLEKENEIGGLCRSKNKDGFIFDYDGHLLHFRQPYTFHLVKGLLKGNLRKHKRSAWINFNSSYIRYPFQANLYGLPSSVVAKCLLGFIQASRNGQHPKKQDLNFQDWIKQTFGQGIAEYFMTPYNTKFWTLSPKELTCEWLEGFIPVPTLSQVIEGTVESSQRLFGYNGWFWYPKKGGINQLALSFAGGIKNIYTGAGVTEIDLTRKEVRAAGGIKERYDYLISTLPLPQLPEIVRNMPENVRGQFRKLRWNSILNLNLGLSRNGLPKRHWVYFPQKEFSFFRLGFYNNFSDNNTPDKRSSLYAEVAYSDQRPIDKRGIIQRVKNDLKKIGFINSRSSVCFEDINDIKYGYPIYDMNYRSARDKIVEYLTLNNVIPCGRYGSWRYFSMEDAILDGRRVAEMF